jgi:hypothetical protein
MVALVRNNRVLVVLLLFFVVGAITDAVQRTFTFSTGFFGACSLIALTQSTFERWASKRSFKRISSSLPSGLSCTERGLNYIDSSGMVSQLEWSEILEVSWSEPDYGYEVGEPYWTIRGTNASFDVEGGWHTGSKDDFPMWLAKALPGFDAEVLEKAKSAGHFKTNSSETLVCWKRADA